MRGSDLRPPATNSEKAKAVHADVQWLVNRASTFVDGGCPLCKKQTTEYVFTKVFNHAYCHDCEVLYIDPRPSGSDVASYYAQSRNYRHWAEQIIPKTAEVRLKSIFLPRANVLKELMKDQEHDDGLLLDIGGAHGLFGRACLDLGLFRQALVIDPNPHLIQLAKQEGLETLCAGYQDFRMANIASVISAFELIEHISAPIDFLRWCHESLKPGGLLMITTPCLDGYELSVLGKHSSNIDHEHICLFSAEGLQKAASKARFERIHYETPGHLDAEHVAATLADAPNSIDPTAQALLSSLLIDATTIQYFQDFLVKKNKSSHSFFIFRAY